MASWRAILENVERWRIRPGLAAFTSISIMPYASFPGEGQVSGNVVACSLRNLIFLLFIQNFVHLFGYRLQGICERFPAQEGILDFFRFNRLPLGCFLRYR